MSKKVSWINQQLARSRLEQTIDLFSQISSYRLLFVSEPIGFGKSHALMKFCLEGHKIHFLTYSNDKARETETELRKVAADNGRELKIIRLFGEKEIPKERKAEDDISSCPNSGRRRLAIAQQRSAWSVCQSPCDFQKRCPYFRTRQSAIDGEYDVIISTLGNLSTEDYYQFREDSAYKEPDFILMDEDAWRKFGLQKSVGINKIDYCLGYLSLRVKEIGGNTLQVQDCSLFPNRMLSIPPIADDELIEAVKIGISKSDLHQWDRWVTFISHTNALVRITQSYDGSEYHLRIIPDASTMKIICADATSTISEISGAFNLPMEQIRQTYNSQDDGFIELHPGAEIHQVLDHIGVESLFVSHSSVTNSDELMLNEKNVEILLGYILENLKRIKTDPSNTFVVTRMDLTKNSRFRELVVKFGLQIDPEIYLGKCRGMNRLADKNVVIFGAMIPNDEDTVVQERLASVLYNETDFCDEYAVRLDNEIVFQSTDKLYTYQAPKKQLSAALWLKRMEKSFSKGRGGRKTAEESIVQAIRGRVFHFPVTVLILSMYPLTKYGFVVNTLEDGEYGRMRMSKPQKPRKADTFIDLLLQNAKRPEHGKGFTLANLNSLRPDKPFGSLESAVKCIRRKLKALGLYCRSVEGKTLVIVWSCDRRSEKISL